jgi:hypothetical protein
MDTRAHVEYARNHHAITSLACHMVWMGLLTLVTPVQTSPFIECDPQQQGVSLARAESHDTNHAMTTKTPKGGRIEHSIGTT